MAPYRPRQRARMSAPPAPKKDCGRNVEVWFAAGRSSALATPIAPRQPQDQSGARSWTAPQRVFHHGDVRVAHPFTSLASLGSPPGGTARAPSTARRFDVFVPHDRRAPASRFTWFRHRLSPRHSLDKLSHSCPCRSTQNTTSGGFCYPQPQDVVRGDSEENSPFQSETAVDNPTASVDNSLDDDRINFLFPPARNPGLKGWIRSTGVGGLPRLPHLAGAPPESWNEPGLAGLSLSTVLLLGGPREPLCRFRAENVATPCRPHFFVDIRARTCFSILSEIREGRGPAPRVPKLPPLPMLAPPRTRVDGCQTTCYTAHPCSG